MSASILTLPSFRTASLVCNEMDLAFVRAAFSR
jgi:hypothetical protein